MRRPSPKCEDLITDVGIASHLPVNWDKVVVEHVWGCGELNLYAVQPAILLIIIYYILGCDLSLKMGGGEATAPPLLLMPVVEE